MVAMKRYLDELVASDLQRKMVLLTGPRQVGKTTLCRHLMERFPPAQYLNWDVAADRSILQRQSWGVRTKLLAMDAGQSLDEVRRVYLEEWDFFCSVLGKGVYRRD